jgi:hypothetical protein
MSLNGWRRLGICVVVLWLSVLSAIAVHQFVSHDIRGSLVHWFFPVGTRVGNGEAILPNGQVVSIDDVDPATGQHLDAWKVDWDHQMHLPFVAHVCWGRLAVLALVIPCASWIALEMLVRAGAWIVAGFRSRAP